MKADTRKPHHVSGWWWRAALFLAFLTAMVRLVLLLTHAERTTVGYIIQYILFVALVASVVVTWILNRRRRKAAEHDPRKRIDP